MSREFALTSSVLGYELFFAVLSFSLNRSVVGAAANCVFLSSYRGRDRNVLFEGSNGWNTSFQIRKNKTPTYLPCSVSAIQAVAAEECSVLNPAEGLLNNVCTYYCREIQNCVPVHMCKF